MVRFANSEYFEVTAELNAPLSEMPRLGKLLGVSLAVQRDDLLPFPLPSSKIRALIAELDSNTTEKSVIVTNGALDSNHCRTLAFLGAERGFRTHLVLHGDANPARARRALGLYDALGATTEVVEPSDIATRVGLAVDYYVSRGLVPRVIPGGCHTPKAAVSYRDAALGVFQKWDPDVVFVASGTGAIQGGLIAASQLHHRPPQVVGVSVARSAAKGLPPVQQAAIWAGATEGGVVTFDDRFTDGGYGKHGEQTRRAVSLGWSYGLPLDCTYTGKAFRGLMHYAAEMESSHLRVLFWHTGGLWDYIQGLGPV